MMQFILWFLASAFSANLATDKFAEVQSGVNAFLAQTKAKPSSVVVAFDYDDTLLSPVSVVGSEAWFNWQESIFGEVKNPDRVASDFEGLLVMQNRMLGLVRMKPTDALIPSYLKTLQNQGYNVIVCTSRGPDEMTTSIRELNLNGIDLAQSEFAKQNEMYKPYLPYDLARPARSGFTREELKKMLLEVPYPVAFANGILFTEGQNKGVMLRALLHRSKMKVSNLVFVDNRKKHTDRVESAFKAHAVKTFTVHYLAVDIDSKPFTGSPEKVERARAEWATLKPFIGEY